MTLKLRLMDYTLEDEGYCVIETSEPKKLIRAAAAYICESDNQCSELMTEQYDPKYDKWLLITEATQSLNSEIDKIRSKYRRLVEGIDNSE